MGPVPKGQGSVLALFYIPLRSQHALSLRWAVGHCLLFASLYSSMHLPVMNGPACRQALLKTTEMFWKHDLQWIVVSGLLSWCKQGVTISSWVTCWISWAPGLIYLAYIFKYNVCLKQDLTGLHQGYLKKQICMFFYWIHHKDIYLSWKKCTHKHIDTCLLSRGIVQTKVTFLSWKHLWRPPWSIKCYQTVHFLLLYNSI